MAEISTFAKRLDEQMAQADAQVAQRRTEFEQAYEARKERYQAFVKVVDQLQDVARPRLDKLAERCAFDARPFENADGKSILLDFKTPVAHIRLRLAGTHDTEIRNLVLSYDLEVLPIYIKFNSHAELQIPLEKFDRATVEAWLDDRLIEFAQTYITIHSTAQYQAKFMVTDPVAKVQFPKMFAHSTLEKDGKTYYFMSEQTRREFEQYQIENWVIDPVCQMRISRAAAEAECTYEGRQYYFCRVDCFQRFQEDPTRYLATPVPSAVTGSQMQQAELKREAEELTQLGREIDEVKAKFVRSQKAR